jgi:hypothetical protein
VSDHIDQALRRRFSFLEMRPTPQCSPVGARRTRRRGGDAFAGSVVKLFEELHARQTADLGPERQIGHSFAEHCQIEAVEPITPGVASKRKLSRLPLPLLPRR